MDNDILQKFKINSRDRFLKNRSLTILYYQIKAITYKNSVLSKKR